MVTSFAQMKPAGVKVQKQDTQIEYQDQCKINEFSRCNMKFHDLQAERMKRGQQMAKDLQSSLLFDAEQRVSVRVAGPPFIQVTRAAIGKRSQRPLLR